MPIGREAEQERIQRTLAAEADLPCAGPAEFCGVGARRARAAPAQAAAHAGGEPHFAAALEVHDAAHGLTNREAAAALFVSATTVEHRLRKLGLGRRAERARTMVSRAPW